MGTVISVENVSKFYDLGLINTGTLHRDLERWWARVRGKSDPLAKIGEPQNGNVEGDYIWALRNVSFQVEQGEVLGIIGRNGAGKSTLLKILSRVTAPTSGQIKAKGRIASLLEVGTGFHPELTGRENIFMNGAILGMSTAEIKRKFDEIVAFSGVEKFIDTPVKRYSSGMYVRLAFAVAAHLEPEILVVDEVLAVGDAAFQKKCLSKMSGVAGEGRTVLFVSHNMTAIRALCPRSLLLDKGQVASDAYTEKTLALYNQFLRESGIDAYTALQDQLHRRGPGSARFTSIAVTDVNGIEKPSFEMGDTIQFRLSFEVFREVPELWVSVALRGGLSSDIVTSVMYPISSARLEAGTIGMAVIDLPDVYIRPGEYGLYYWLGKTSHPRRMDVVDGLTPPLVIRAGCRLPSRDFEPSEPVGYFSVPSKLVSIRLDSRGATYV